VAASHLVRLHKVTQLVLVHTVCHASRLSRVHLSRSNRGLKLLQAQRLSIVEHKDGELRIPC